jgi:hypothetical protein
MSQVQNTGVMISDGAEFEGSVVICMSGRVSLIYKQIYVYDELSLGLIKVFMNPTGKFS